MKIKDGFRVRKMFNRAVVVRIKNSPDEFNGMITLNETGEFLWSELEKGADKQGLVKALLENYEGIDEETASADVAEFIEAAYHAGVLED